MRAFLEVVELRNDIVTTSGGAEDDCNGCDLGCPEDLQQMGGDM